MEGISLVYVLSFLVQAVRNHTFFWWGCLFSLIQLLLLDCHWVFLLKVSCCQICCLYPNQFWPLSYQFWLLSCGLLLFRFLSQNLVLTLSPSLLVNAWPHTHYYVLWFSFGEVGVLFFLYIEHVSVLDYFTVVNNNHRYNYHSKFKKEKHKLISVLLLFFLTTKTTTSTLQHCITQRNCTQVLSPQTSLTAYILSYSKQAYGLSLYESNINFIFKNVATNDFTKILKDVPKMLSTCMIDNNKSKSGATTRGQEDMMNSLFMLKWP